MTKCGICHEDLGDDTKAIECYRTAISLLRAVGPRAQKADERRRRRARRLQQQGRDDGAETGSGGGGDDSESDSSSSSDGDGSGDGSDGAASDGGEGGSNLELTDIQVAKRHAPPEEGSGEALEVAAATTTGSRPLVQTRTKSGPHFCPPPPPRPPGQQVKELIKYTLFNLGRCFEGAR